MVKPQLIVNQTGEFDLGGFKGDPVKTIHKISYIVQSLGGYFSSGTFLGLWRDGEIIKHDSDIDVSITHTEPRLDRSFELIGAMKNENCELVYFVCEKDLTHQLVFVDKDNQDNVVDVEFYYTFNDNDTRHLKQEGVLEIKYYAPVLWEYKGVKIPIPALPDDYLTARYGDWRTPYSEKGDWKDYTECFKAW